MSAHTDNERSEAAVDVPRLVLLCPECGSDALYGPVSDYWGRMCVDCLHEIIPEKMKNDIDVNQEACKVKP